MKIAIYLEQYERGGVDTHLLTLLSCWNQEQDSFTIFCNLEHKGLAQIREQAARLPNVRVCTYRSFAYDRIRKLFPRPFGMSLFLCFPFFFSLQYLQSKRLLATGGFEGLLADNGGYPASWGVLASVLAAKNLKIGKRVLLVHHAADPPRPFLGFFERMVDYAVSRGTTDLVAVSRATRATLEACRFLGQGDKPVQIVYNGISLKGNSDSVKTVDLRKRYSLDYSLLVGMVGRIEPYKGQEDLIVGFSGLPRECRDRMTLVFIGDGDEREVGRLRALTSVLGVAERTVFTGYIPGDPHQLITQLDLLAVLTRDFEGFGLTLGEAMAVNVPVLATSVGAIPEFIDDTCGMLVPPASPGEVAKALADFLEMPEKWRERSSKALDVIASFSSERMVAEFKRIFY